jgi:hypothetical protein
MCWNQEVSLNTFLFSSFAMLLIMYNNKYTQYKIAYFNTVWKYLFFWSFIIIQLIEFFIWRNINDPFYNKVFSILAVVALLFQPVISLMMISNHSIRNPLLTAYLIFIIPYFIYNAFTNNIYSFVSKKGHLDWHFFKMLFVLLLIWMPFFFFGLLYEGHVIAKIFGTVLYAVCIYNYYADKTVLSNWCWIVNSMFIYYLSYLLFYLPYCERKSMC